MTDKVWKKDEIKQKLVSGDTKWIEHAVVAIFYKQTESEKAADNTHHRNGVGFTSADANIMSIFAKWLMKGKSNHLSQKQMDIAKKKIVKYAGQLTKIANGKI